jgi:hypothetical protein
VHPERQGFVLYLDENRPTAQRFRDDIGSGTYGDALPARQWQHLVATFDGARMRIYMQGELVRVEPDPTTVAVADISAQLVIGKASSGEYSFKGVIDEVAIYEHELGPTAIQRHFEAARR